MMTLYDAHNHLQDPRLRGQVADVLNACERIGVRRMVVNGSCERDWPEVLTLARLHPLVLPSFGVHPWQVRERSAGWMDVLKRHLDAVPSAIGEIGLDRWIDDPDVPGQEELFRAQLRLAAERNLPASIHCLRAWGRLEAILREEPRPACGFLLHSYGGPAEMVDKFAELGASFSLSGYFAHARKSKQRATFRRVPLDRLLLETDAPDMWPPREWNDHPLADPTTGRPLNHPANLAAIYRFAAELLEVNQGELTTRVVQNFQRLFGPVSQA